MANVDEIGLIDSLTRAAHAKLNRRLERAESKFNTFIFENAFHFYYRILMDLPDFFCCIKRISYFYLFTFYPLKSIGIFLIINRFKFAL